MNWKIKYQRLIKWLLREIKPMIAFFNISLRRPLSPPDRLQVWNKEKTLTEIKSERGKEKLSSNPYNSLKYQQHQWENLTKRLTNTSQMLPKPLKKQIKSQMHTFMKSNLARQLRKIGIWRFWASFKRKKTITQAKRLADPSKTIIRPWRGISSRMKNKGKSWTASRVDIWRMEIRLREPRNDKLFFQKHEKSKI